MSETEILALRVRLTAALATLEELTAVLQQFPELTADKNTKRGKALIKLQDQARNQLHKAYFRQEL